MALVRIAAALSLFVPVEASAQPAQSEPPIVENAPTARSTPRGPRTRPFVEGGRAPAGYVLRDESMVAVIAGGASVFGLAYVLTLIGYAVATEGCGGGDGPCADGLWPLWFPAVGPLIAIGTSHVGDGMAGALALDGVFQCVGIGLVIFGLAIEKTFWLRADLAGLHAAPVALSGGGRGLALSGRF